MLLSWLCRWGKEKVRPGRKARLAVRRPRVDGRLALERLEDREVMSVGLAPSAVSVGQIAAPSTLAVLSSNTNAHTTTTTITSKSTINIAQVEAVRQAILSLHQDSTAGAWSPGTPANQIEIYNGLTAQLTALPGDPGAKTFRTNQGPLPGGGNNVDQGNRPTNPDNSSANPDSSSTGNSSVALPDFRTAPSSAPSERANPAIMPFFQPQQQNLDSALPTPGKEDASTPLPGTHHDFLLDTVFTWDRSQIMTPPIREEVKPGQQAAADQGDAAGRVLEVATLAAALTGSGGRRASVAAKHRRSRRGQQVDREVCPTRLPGLFPFAMLIGIRPNPSSFSLPSRPMR
jgi:hypothetical protein